MDKIRWIAQRHYFPLASAKVIYSPFRYGGIVLWKRTYDCMSISGVLHEDSGTCVVIVVGGGGSAFVAIVVFVWLVLFFLVWFRLCLVWFGLVCFVLCLVGWVLFCFVFCFLFFFGRGSGLLFRVSVRVCECLFVSFFVYLVVYF